MSFLTQEKNEKGSFGSMIVSEETPVVQLVNQYSVDVSLKSDLEVYSATGGTTDMDNNMFRCQTGTSVGGYGVIRSKETSRYRPGQGIVGRFTALFTAGVANYQQGAGYFSLTETLAFGYDGTSFGIIHEHDGAAEVQSIQVTATPSGGENCTVTLDGDAVVIALTASNVQTNAQEIRAGLIADATVGAKWRFEQVDDTCICLSQTVGNKTGTMSFSSATATATVTEKKAGTAKTVNFIAQGSWNGTAPFAGFDPTQFNLYKIQYGYLGVAGPEFYLYNPTTGDFDLVHREIWANANTQPLFGNPSMKIGWYAASLGGSGSNLTVKGASALSAIEGKEVVQEPSKSVNNSKSAVSTTFTNIVTVKNRIEYGNRYNLSALIPVTISFELDHNKGAIVELRKNATLGGTTNYQYVDANNSFAAFDTAGTTVTNGELLQSFTVPAGGSVLTNITVLHLFLLPEETLTIGARTVSGASTTMTAAITWLEEK